MERNSPAPYWDKVLDVAYSIDVSSAGKIHPSRITDFRAEALAAITEVVRKYFSNTSHIVESGRYGYRAYEWNAKHSTSDEEV